MIGDDKLYIYIDDQSPHKKINYSYSKYSGEKFLSSWQSIRESAIVDLVPSTNFLRLKTTYDSSRLFKNWIQNGVDESQLNLLIKRFEVTRKIYESYNNEFRPKSDSKNYEIMECYVLFSYLLCTQFKLAPKVQYVNALLKCNDIIISNLNEINENLKGLFAECIKEEIKIVTDLREELK